MLGLFSQLAAYLFPRPAMTHWHQMESLSTLYHGGMALGLCALG